jgi:sec-independent protein translocase protein TatC
MSHTSFKPFKYLSRIFHAGLNKKLKRQACIEGDHSLKISFLDHIQELRKHVIRATIWFSFFCTLSFIFMKPLVAFLKKPYDSLLFFVKQQQASPELSAMSIFEVMTVNFKICFLVGFAASLPFFAREIWKFVSPALYKKEKKVVAVSLCSSVALFYAGLCFGFFLIIPYFFQTCLQWADQYAAVMITYENYFNALITMMLIFCAVFEVPVFLALLGLVGILSSQFLVENRKVSFLACFIIGAFLSPPEVLSLCLVAFPLYAMVEISIYIIKKIEKSKKLHDI